MLWLYSESVYTVFCFPVNCYSELSLNYRHIIKIKKKFLKALTHIYMERDQIKSDRIALS